MNEVKLRANLYMNVGSAWDAAIAVVGATALLCHLPTTAHAQQSGAQIETGSIAKDAVVAPVRRVFPKTPSDRELDRLSRQATKSKKQDQSKTH